MRKIEGGAGAGLAGIFLSICLLGSSAVLADEMTRAIEQMCTKTKVCMQERFGGSDQVSPEMKAMIMQQMGMACDYMAAQYAAAPKGHPIYQPALQCLKSMAAMSCDELDAIDDNPTPECERYEEMSEQY